MRDLSTLTLCHYLSTRGHEFAETDPELLLELSRAVVLRETYSGGYVPVCDACADTPSEYATEYLSLESLEERS